MPAHFLGADGGGTSTRVLMISAAGDVLGFGTSGSSNFHEAGRDAADAALKAAVAAAYSNAGIGRESCGAIFLGMAGVVAEADRRVVREMVGVLNLNRAARVGVDHDIRIALAGGLGADTGIALIAGTGSSCYGRDGKGNDWRAGGWGSLLDDRGSSYGLGLEAMIATVRGHDGRGPATALAADVLEHLKIGDIQEIMHRLHHIGTSKAEIAALAPCVIARALEGDEAARAIVDRGIWELVLAVQTVARRLEFDFSPIPLSVSGGLAENSAYYRELLFGRLNKISLPVAPRLPMMPPVFGAAILAAEIAGARLDAAAIDRMKTQIP